MRKVCRYLHDLIRDTLGLKYRLELSVSRSDDGFSGSDLSLAERYRLLLDRQEAWRELRWQSELEIPMVSTNHQWDLTDGILAENTDEYALVINQVPSRFRGIEAKHWEYKTEFPMRDFASDVRQDLLVVIEQPDEQCVPELDTCDFHV